MNLPLLRRADVLLIVPPFAWLDRPALGVHLLQAVARAAGLEAQVLYANFLFTRFFDEGTHNTVAQMQYGLYLGERLFARAALGAPALGHDEGAGMMPVLDALAAGYRRMNVAHTFTLDAIRALEAKVPAWLDTFVPAIAEMAYPIVGCTTSFEQNLSSLAILGGVKRAAPSTKVIIGGANCEGPMAEGIRALAPWLDHVFSGESEHVFGELLAGRLDAPIISGEPCDDLDALPALDFSDYFTQLAQVMTNTDVVRRRASHLTYESSRGCWWGQKSHCTFCGLNGQGMRSRNKSADTVIADLKRLTEAHDVRRIAMTDNIMPHEFFQSFLPRLPAELPGVSLMYEEKANLRLDQVRALVEAGVVEIQPGIEAISTGLLKLMAKGTTAAQNIALLRYARATNLLVQWNLLHGFPNDELESYRETLGLLPLLHHLQPPVSPCPVVIDRFSPYFERPEQYGITELRPFGFYRGVYGSDVPLEKLAYHFEGTFPSAARSHPDVIREIADGVASWRRRFYGPVPPRLAIDRAGDAYRLVDTRGFEGIPVETVLTEEQAIAAMTTRPVRSVAPELAAWLRARKLVAECDGKLVALAIATPELFAELESRHVARPLLQVVQQ